VRKDKLCCMFAPLMFYLYAQFGFACVCCTCVDLSARPSARSASVRSLGRCGRRVSVLLRSIAIWGARLPFWLRSHFACLFSCLTSVCEYYLLFCPLCARSLCCCSLCLLLLSLVFRLLNPLVVVVVYSAIKPVYPSSGLVGTFKSIINLNPHKLVSTHSSCVAGF
jgi:hypothetical protein